MAKDQILKVRISDEQRAQLDAECEKYGVSLSDLVRYKCARILLKTEADYLTRAFA